MNPTDISTQMLFSTLPIRTGDGQGRTRSATAFIYGIPIPGRPGHAIPVLVTSLSKLEGARSCELELTGREGTLPSRETRVRVELAPDQLNQYGSRELDVALILLGPVLNQLEQSGRPVFFRSITPGLIPGAESLPELSALEETVVLGYPAGWGDESQANPLARRGLTATPFGSDFQGRPEFLMDAGTLPEACGSPVFIFNQGAYPTRNGMVVGRRVLFLGMVLPALPQAEAEPTRGLVRVVKSTAIKEFIDTSLKDLVRLA